SGAAGHERSHRRDAPRTTGRDGPAGGGDLRAHHEVRDRDGARMKASALPRRPLFGWMVDHAMHVAFVVMAIYFAAATGGRFVTVENLLNVLNQNFAYLTLGVGMTLVILSGGIDLSIGSLVALCGVLGTSVMAQGGIVFSDSGGVVRLLPAGVPL